MCRALGLLALLGLLTAVGAGARDRPSLHDDWPSYLHDASNSGTSIDPSAPSPSTVGRLATAWSAVVELGQFNGMAISDGRIYVQGPHLNAYSATDGSGVWSVLANATGDGVPAVADGVVYVGASVDGKGALEAFDGATGALLRTTALPGSVDAQGSPTVADGEVFEPAAGLYAVDQTTGTVLWHVPDVSSIGAAAVVDGVVYVIGGSGGADLEALDARTGQLLWEGYPGHGAGLGEGTVTVADGTAYYASSDTAHAWVAAFSAGGCGTTPCKPLWTAQLPGVHAAAAPVVADGELFIGSDDTFYALDAHTGSLIWSSVLHGFIESSALVANGVVYVGTNETDLYAFGADACGGGPACAPLWHHHFPPPLGQASTQDGFTRPPIFAEGRLYALMGNGNLYALQVGAGGDEPETGWLYGPASDEGPTDDPFSIWFDSDDPTATFECEVDGGAWTPCTSPAWFAAGGPGQHMIEIRAVDAQGHADPTPLKFWWIRRPYPPDTSITSGPSGTVADGGARFTFTSTAIASTFACSLDGGPFVPCASPTTYSGLASGSHTFAVQATDPVGQPDPTPASAAWTVAFVIPSAPTPAPPRPTPGGEGSLPSWPTAQAEAPGRFLARWDRLARAAQSAAARGTLAWGP